MARAERQRGAEKPRRAPWLRGRRGLRLAIAAPPSQAWAMEWRDKGIALGTRRHSETSPILEVMTRAHGRHLGIVL